jgi:hypothetical protein
MTRSTISVVFFFAVVFAGKAIACSPSRALGYEIAFPPVPWAEATVELLGAPDIRIKSLRRGQSADYEACLDHASLTLAFNSEPNKAVVAYLLRVARGNFPGIVPDIYVLPVPVGDGLIGFHFRWSDFPRDQLPIGEIDATLEIRQISSDGRESEPTLVRIRDAGSPANNRMERTRDE